LGPVLAWRPASTACSGCGTLATAASPQELAAALGIHYRTYVGHDDVEGVTRFWGRPPAMVETTGFDLIFPSFRCDAEQGECLLTEDASSPTWAVQLDHTVLVLYRDQREVARVPLADVEPEVTRLASDAPHKPIVREGSWKGAGRYRLLISAIVFNHGEHSVSVRLT